MRRALMPGEHERMTDQAIREALPHFWVAISMVFCIAATFFTLLKLCGDVASGNTAHFQHLRKMTTGKNPGVLRVIQPTFTFFICSGFAPSRSLFSFSQRSGSGASCNVVLDFPPSSLSLQDLILHINLES